MSHGCPKRCTRNNGAGAVGDVRLNGFGGHVQRLGVYVGKDGHGVLHEDWHNAAGIGDRGGDDSSPGWDSLHRPLCGWRRSRLVMLARTVPRKMQRIPFRVP